ncbi:hypothetical protein [Cohnella lupini]|nr:hypothetical protein [Cohnella lupini]
MKERLNEQIVELDATELDFFIDEKGLRPTIKFAVDQYTRKVVGLCINLSLPDKAQIEECLQNVTLKGRV